MFFAFCWKEPEPPPPDPAHKNIPMITSMLEEMEKAEKAEAAANAKEAALGEVIKYSFCPEISARVTLITEMVARYFIINKWHFWKVYEYILL